MATPDECVDDVFQPGGRLRLELLTQSAIDALKESLRLARRPRWDSVRTPHLFMGLLAGPDPASALGPAARGRPARLLDQFRELFHQDEGEADAAAAAQPRVPLRQRHPPAARRATAAARDHGRGQITPMDLLITLFTTPNSIVAECFERIGVTAAKLTELAVIAEHTAPRQRRRPQQETELTARPLPMAPDPRQANPPVASLFVHLARPRLSIKNPAGDATMRNRPPALPQSG